MAGWFRGMSVDQTACAISRSVTYIHIYIYDMTYMDSLTHSLTHVCVYGQIGTQYLYIYKKHIVPSYAYIRCYLRWDRETRAVSAMRRRGHGTMPEMQRSSDEAPEELGKLECDM